MNSQKQYEMNRNWEKKNRKRFPMVVRPEVLEQIDKAAKQAGQSRTEWVLRAIQDKLDNNK